MKLIKSCLMTLTLAALISTISFAHSPHGEDHPEVETNITKYLDSAELALQKGSVLVITNFIVKEHGEIYSVDFLVTDNREVIILSKKKDDEYYRVSTYNPQFVKQYSVPVSDIVI